MSRAIYLPWLRSNESDLKSSRWDIRGVRVKSDHEAYRWCSSQNLINIISPRDKPASVVVLKSSFDSS